MRREIERIPFFTGWGDNWVRAGSLKTVIDGGILIGTAFLREPYGSNTQIYGYVDPDYRGVLAVPRENVVEMAKTAAELGWQMTSHTTGGGATDILLDGYEAADKTTPIAGRRFVVTHGNFPNRDAIARSQKLGVAFDIQPFWLYLDGPVIKDVFGPERMPVAGIPRDEPGFDERGQRPPEGFAAHPEPAAQRREPAPLRPLDLGEDGKRPAVVAELGEG